MAERSWCDIAAERRCAWPRLPPGGPLPETGGVGSVPSAFVGLVLIKPGPLGFPLPPMNSLPPLRWPPDLGGILMLRDGECARVSFGVTTLSLLEGGKSKTGRGLTDMLFGLERLEKRLPLVDPAPD